MKTRRTILIVDDHPIFRHGLAQLINQEHDLEVCGEAEDYHSALTCVERLAPDLVIVDITLKNMSGIDLIKDLHRYYRTLPMLVISMHEESLYAERSLRAGARGYIMKQEASESVIDAIRQVLQGRIYASRDVTDRLLTRFVEGQHSTLESPVHALTDRELEVFRLIGEGLGLSEIADRLNLSAKTIGTYRERIKDKLGIKNATELLRYAMKWVEEDHIPQEKTRK
ncbi:MAG TPA: response regulator transcription factor [Deltaproteobacteria bacterium]|nr:response regulator transcription factor [Deltaproteobacteria bacterium]MDI9541672.1 response regulator transcription factor [Pseudomonadota bacterium]HON61216.1 response regulator transcription factor [Deltaproteobacteria bacterium]HPA83369.1 response regulator transcription factor [Deltaproteobacteria bacterium]HPV29980.1 response regulator transcription factor [Deltaproteobacteria bacterium]